MLPSVFPNNKNPSFAWYRTHLTGEIRNARQRQAQSLEKKYLALIKEGKIAEADAALTREPPTAAAAAPRLALVAAYLKKGDQAAARRHLEPAAVGASKTTVADFSIPVYFASNRIEIADDYIAVGDLAASRRVLDATAGTILKIPKPTTGDRRSNISAAPTPVLPPPRRHAKLRRRQDRAMEVSAGCAGSSAAAPKPSPDLPVSAKVGSRTSWRQPCLRCPQAATKKRSESAGQAFHGARSG